MGWFLPANNDSFPGDSKERKEASLAAAGALCNEEDIIEDWGDYNGDYADTAHQKANGEGDSDRKGPHGSSMEDINAFYNSCTAQNIRIRKRPNGSGDN